MARTTERRRSRAHQDEPAIALARPGLPARVAWGALALVAAVVAGGVQLDRQARESLSIARQVPAPFAGYALETMARDAYREGDNARGLELSKTLITRRPEPAESLGLLSNGFLAAGDEGKALSALLLSAERGWRDRFTQHLMVSAGLQSGDYDVAAQRLIALWREGDRGEATQGLSRAVFADPAGLAAFENQISGSEQYWATDFLFWAGDNLTGTTVASLARAMGRGGAQVGCSSLSVKTVQMVRYGKPAGAMGIWNSLCAQGKAGAPGDFAFREVEGLKGPFDWRFPDEAGLETWFEAQGEGKAARSVLRFENSVPLRKIFANRPAMLAAGQHRVAVRMERDDPRASRPLQLQVRCFRDDGSFGATQQLDLPVDGAVEFALPDQACATQDLALITPRGGGAIAQFSIR